MAGPVVPTLAPNVNVLATIVGTPLDLLHFVIRGRADLLALRATPSHGNGYHRTLTPARGALRRGSLCWGWSWTPLFFSWKGGRDPISLLCNVARERHPRGLIAPCRGARPSLVLGRFLLGNLCRGRNCGLLCRLLADGLLGGIVISNCRLGCPQAGSVARINIRGRTNKEELMQITILTSNLIKNKESTESLFQTYRSELRCAAVKNLLLVRPAAAAASVPPGRIGSTCAAGGSLITRSASIGATLGRLRGL